MATPNTQVRASSTSREYWKFIGVLIFIALASTLMSSLISFSWDGWLRWFVGGLLLVLGGFKLIGFEAFTAIFPQYDIIAARYTAYAYLYPILEVILGICFILNMLPWPRNVVTLFITTLGSYGMYYNLSRRGPTVYTPCLGNVIKLPLSTVMLFEDFIVAVLVGLVIFLN